MSEPPVAEHARRLETARSQAQAVECIAGLDLAAAYRIQDEGIRLRAAAGDKPVGYKMGLTSKAKMKQMGVDTPIMGRLTESMRVTSGSSLGLGGLIHPRVEPEIAFLVRRDLRGKPSLEESLAACSSVCAALEIIDSRYRDFKFTLPAVVADNCSSCAFVLGPDARRPEELELGRLPIELAVNGKTVESGSSEAIYGHPGLALAELAAMLDARGLWLEAGSIVLAGAATAAVLLEPGETRARVSGLGEVSVRVTPGPAGARPA